MKDTVPGTEYIKANKRVLKKPTWNSEERGNKQKSSKQHWEVGNTPILQVRKLEASWGCSLLKSTESINVGLRPHFLNLQGHVHTAASTVSRAGSMQPFCSPIRHMYSELQKGSEKGRYRTVVSTWMSFFLEKSHFIAWSGLSQNDELQALLYLPSHDGHQANTVTGWSQLMPHLKYESTLFYVP